MYLSKEVVNSNALIQRSSEVVCTYPKEKLSFMYLPNEGVTFMYLPNEGVKFHVLTQ